MRNLKKILALALALVMTLSLMTVANAFNDDKDIDATYNEAVQVLTGLKVFKGVNDGSNFAPKQTITRGEVAAIIYRIVTGDVNDTGIARYAAYAETSFDDVKATDWYAGYIGYCANAELIVGDGTNFYPAQTVNGYQALAMILRAVGYDQNDEFKGSGWEIRVASTAQQLTLLKNIGATSLSGNASREMVAELLFRALVYAPMVQYTSAFGYQPVVSLTNVNIYDGTVKVDLNGQTLGMATFGLKQSGLTDIDVWGRPGYIWDTNKTANVWTGANTVATITIAPVYTTTVKVDECDIAEAIGLKANTPLEKAYIDGDSVRTTSADVTTNQYASINPLATTSYVGAQGRLTEVYDMGGSLRLVEINTYLAQVDKVTPIYTDKNGHVVDATVDLLVYSGVKNTSGAATSTVTWNFDGIRATGYAVGDYVLVTVSNVDQANAVASQNKASIESIKAAPLTSGGNLAGWTNAVATTPATTVVGTTTYNDADKFFYNLRTAGNWMVATDDYGNVIGLVPATVNYLVIEKIEWEDTLGTVGGGYAIADVVLADGSRVQNVTISTVGGQAVKNTDTTGTVASNSVSDYYMVNADYYNHIFTYSVNSNGSYNIAKSNHTASGAMPVDVNGSITNGVATINTNTNTYVATNTTVFLVQNADGYTYTTYVGKDVVPSVSGDLCILTDTSGYATLVVVDNPVLASNTFYAYVTSNSNVGQNALGTAYWVYKVGDTTPTLVYDANGATTGGWAYDATHETGLYSFTVNADNQIQTMSTVLCDLHCGNSAANVITGWDRSAVKASVKDGSFQTDGYSAVTAAANDNGYTVTATNTAVKDFNVTDATKYIVVTKNALTGSAATLTAGTSADLTKDSVVLVNYTTAGTKYTANVVYILRIGSTGVNPNPNPGTSTLTLSKPGAKVEPTFTNKTGATQSVTITFYYRVANSGANYSTYSTGTGSVANNASNTWTSSGLTLPSFSTATSYEVYAVATGAGGTVLATSAIYNYIA